MQRKSNIRLGIAMTFTATTIGFGGLLAPRAALAQSTGGGAVLNATAVVGPGGSTTPPVIECAWALPDYGSTQSWYDGMQYGQDDSTNVPGPAAPCKTPTYGVTSRPIQANQPTVGTAPIHVNVLPNRDDQPTQRYIELWMATDSTDLGTVAHWKVFHPDGTYKVQVEGTNYTQGSQASKCSGPSGMFTAAVNTGQIEANTVANSTTAIHDSLQDFCKQNLKDFYYGSFGLSKHQPYGKYRIDATVIKPANGGQAVLSYWIEVSELTYLAKDFNALDFGSSIQAGQTYNIAGDTAWNPPGDNTAPTLQSQGNVGITVEMAYTDLCLQVPATGGSVRDCGPGKQITRYDGGLGTSIDTVEHRDPVAHSEIEADILASGFPFTSFLTAYDTTFGPRYRTMCPNDLAKVDFSMHTPGTLQSGMFAGKVHLKVVKSPLCPTDDGHVYGPPFNDPNVVLQGAWNGITPKDTGYWTV
jgi:hypothetical protein